MYEIWGLQDGATFPIHSAPSGARLKFNFWKDACKKAEELNAGLIYKTIAYFPRVAEWHTQGVANG